MQKLWRKLMRLRHVLLKLNRTKDIQQKKDVARHDLDQAYLELRTNNMEASRIEKVKKLSGNLQYWNEMEKK